MYNRITALVLVALMFALWGCGDKLTPETAKDIIQKEFIAKQPKRFSTIKFEKGSKGFEYFQQFIADGSFELTKKEEVWEPLSREPVFEKTYAPKPELADVYKQMTVRDEVVIEKTNVLDMMDIVTGKRTLKMIPVCSVAYRISVPTVQSLESVFNDEKNGTAVVEFTVAEVGVAPYYDDLCPIISEASKRDCLRKPYPAKVRLKKYDEGWRVD